MKKTLFLILLGLFLVILTFAYGKCSDETQCLTSSKNPCLPDSQECIYYKYLSDDGCKIDSSFTDIDSDSDGWTDGCDAFVFDKDEWMDLDGDGVGHNSDCDDFDFANTFDCTKAEEESETDAKDDFSENDSNEDIENEDENNPSADTKSESFGSPLKFCTPVYECTEWSRCIDGKKTRSCAQVNECATEEDPKESEDCLLVTEITGKPRQNGQVSGENKTTGLDIPQNSTLPASGPDEKKNGGLPAITGNAFALYSGSMGYGLLILLGALVLFLLIKRKKSKSEVAV